MDCHNLGHPTGGFSDLIIQNNTKFKTGKNNWDLETCRKSQKFDRFLIDNFFCDSFQVFDDLTSFSNNPIILILIGICIRPNMPSFIQHISSLLRMQCWYSFCSAYSSHCLLCTEARVTGQYVKFHISESEHLGLASAYFQSQQPFIQPCFISGESGIYCKVPSINTSCLVT